MMNTESENIIKMICLKKLLLKEKGSEDMLNRVINPKTNSEKTIR